MWWQEGKPADSINVCKIFSAIHFETVLTIIMVGLLSKKDTFSLE